MVASDSRTRPPMTRRVPSELPPRDPRMDLPRLLDPSHAYHEAGHAVVFCHYGIRFRYVTLRPRLPGNAGHVYVGRRRILRTIDEIENMMQATAAGTIAEQWIFRLRRVPATEESLLRGLTAAAADPASPWLAEDTRNFVRLGAGRDDDLLATSPDALTGPEAWLAVWREAERVVMELWPAVYATAWEMVFSSRALTYAEVAEISGTALEQDVADRVRLRAERAETAPTDDAATA